MVLVIYSVWHQSLTAGAPCNKMEKHSSVVINAQTPKCGHLANTESKRISHEVDEQDADYEANLARYMAEKEKFRACSKL